MRLNVKYKAMVKKLFIIALLIVFSVSLFGYDVLAGSKYKVVEVLDGDTIKVKRNSKIKTVRLIGIDAPELKSSECFSKKAYKKTKRRLLGKKIRLRRDKTIDSRDMYGRLLRYVILKNGRNFNRLMLRRGFAYEYTFGKSYVYSLLFKTAQQKAINGKEGLWAKDTCNGKRQKVIKKHIYYVSSYGSAKYYYCDTDSAWKGLSPKYLRQFNSVKELLREFPGRILHEACI